mgnify:CR=1 FL=1|tara:strand:- start:3340 stop:3615 length:276 start_codon:yes stop_codon:yes gene_type:complete
MNTDNKNTQAEQCTIPSIGSSAFIRGKKRLPKGKYKNVYSYKMPDGSIKYQSYISKYRWSKYHETERQAAISVDKYLILKGKEPVNILFRK